MQKLLATLIGLFMIGGIAAVAQAEPGPNESNNHGLCTAYNNGQKKGHDRNGAPGPFQALEDAADEDDGEDGADSGDAMETAADVYDYCQAYGIGGNPEHGRFDCTIGDDENDTTCEPTEAPGNSGGGRGSGKAKNKG